MAAKKSTKSPKAKSTKEAGGLRSIAVCDEFSIVEQTLHRDTTPTPPPNINHIFMCDVSGSMWGLLDPLVRDVKARLRGLRVGDTVSLGWFSGHGDYRFVLKGFEIKSTDDFAKIDRALDDFRIRGMTCFSEILREASELVNDLKYTVNSSVFAMTFLTDGYPTVSPYAKEITDIEAAIKAIRGRIAAALIVGYGGYYNKELLSTMAEQIGGVLIHSSDLAKFPAEYGLFLERARGVSAGIAVTLEVDATYGAFVISDGAVQALAVHGQQVLVSNNAGAVYVISNTPAKLPKLDGEAAERALYAAALVLTQKQRVDFALDVLGKLRDKAAIKLVTNAFTNDEYGAAEQLFVSAVGKPEFRFLGGKTVAGAVPPRNAFCMLDALDMLVEDEDAYFFPRSEAFDYKPIGPPSKTKSGYPEFKPFNGEDVSTPFSKLVWNLDKTNISVLANIPGTIDLPKELTIGEAAVFIRPDSLAPERPTYQWRNYAFVKNGFCNVKKVPMRMSQETYTKFVDEGMIDDGAPWAQKRVFLVDFRKIPVMNRAMADSYVSKAGDLADLAVIEIQLMAHAKVLKAKLAKLEPKAERPVDTTVGPEANAYLKLVGITFDGSYAPPKLPPETTDFYIANTFEIRVAGCSSLPSIADVEKKLASKKPELTLSQAVMHDAMISAASFGDDVFLIKPALSNTNGRLKSIRATMQRAKFAVVLGKRWFSDFGSRTDCKIQKTLGGRIVSVEFVLGEEQVEF